MGKFKRYPLKIGIKKKEFLPLQNKIKSNWKMLASRLEHRQVEGKRKK